MNADRQAQLDQLIDAVTMHIAVMKGQNREPDRWEAECLSHAFGFALVGWDFAAGTAVSKARAPAEETAGDRTRTHDTPTIADLVRGLDMLRSLRR